jgi:hypothetical protein
MVVNVGTNDVYGGNLNWRHEYDTMVRSLADIRCVALFTVNRLVYRSQGIPSAEQFNAHIFEIAKTHRNVHVVDWDRAVQNDLTLLYDPASGVRGDFIHPVAKGQRWIADHTKTVLATCGLRGM